MFAKYFFASLPLAKFNNKNFQYFVCKSLSGATNMSTTQGICIFTIYSILFFAIIITAGILIRDVSRLKETMEEPIYGPDFFDHLLMAASLAIVAMILQMSFLIYVWQVKTTRNWVKWLRLGINLVIASFLGASFMVPVVQTFPNSYQETEPFLFVTAIGFLLDLVLTIMYGVRLWLSPSEFKWSESYLDLEARLNVGGQRSSLATEVIHEFS